MKGYIVRADRGILMASSADALRRKDVDAYAVIAELTEAEWRKHASGIDHIPLRFTPEDQSFSALDYMLWEAEYGERPCQL